MKRENNLVKGGSNNNKSSSTALQSKNQSGNGAARSKKHTPQNSFFKQANDSLDQSQFLLQQITMPDIRPSGHFSVDQHQRSNHQILKASGSKAKINPFKQQQLPSQQQTLEKESNWRPSLNEQSLLHRVNSQENVQSMMIIQPKKRSKKKKDKLIQSPISVNTASKDGSSQKVIKDVGMNRKESADKDGFLIQQTQIYQKASTQKGRQIDRHQQPQVAVLRPQGRLKNELTAKKQKINQDNDEKDIDGILPMKLGIYANVTPTYNRIGDQNALSALHTSTIPQKLDYQGATNNHGSGKKSAMGQNTNTFDKSHSSVSYSNLAQSPIKARQKKQINHDKSKQSMKIVENSRMLSQHQAMQPLHSVSKSSVYNSEVARASSVVINSSTSEWPPQKLSSVHGVEIYPLNTDSGDLILKRPAMAPDQSVHMSVKLSQQHSKLLGKMAAAQNYSRQFRTGILDKNSQSHQQFTGAAASSQDSIKIQMPQFPHVMITNNSQSNYQGSLSLSQTKQQKSRYEQIINNDDEVIIGEQQQRKDAGVKYDMHNQQQQHFISNKVNQALSKQQLKARETLGRAMAKLPESQLQLSPPVKRSTVTLVRKVKDNANLLKAQNQQSTQVQLASENKTSKKQASNAHDDYTMALRQSQQILQQENHRSLSQVQQVGHDQRNQRQQNMQPQMSVQSKDSMHRRGNVNLSPLGQSRKIKAVYDISSPKTQNRTSDKLIQITDNQVRKFLRKSMDQAQVPSEMIDKNNIDQGRQSQQIESLNLQQQNLSQASNDTNYLLFPFIGKQQTKSSRNFNKTNSEMQLSDANQDPAGAYAQKPPTQAYSSSQKTASNVQQYNHSNSYVGHSKKRQMLVNHATSLSKSVIADQPESQSRQPNTMESSSKSSNFLGSAAIQVSTSRVQPQMPPFNINSQNTLKSSKNSKFYQLKLDASQIKVSSLQYPQIANKNTTSLQGRKISQPSEFSKNNSVNRCDITLSEDSEAPTRLAMPGQMPFNSLTSQSSYRLKSGDEDPHNQQANNSSSNYVASTPSSTTILTLKRQKMLEKIAKLNLAEVIQDQKRKHPELNQLSNEELNQILIHHIIQLKEIQDNQSVVQGTIDDYNFSKAHHKAITKNDNSHNDRAQQSTQNAAQIVNHFNITINHSGTGQPNTSEPTNNNSSSLFTTENAQEYGQSSSSQHEQQKLTYNDLQSIILARDQALQKMVHQRLKESATNLQAQMEAKETGVDLDRNFINKRHSNAMDPNMSPSIRIKQPRIKRRPILDTNLSRSASKTILNNQLQNNQNQPSKNINNVPPPNGQGLSSAESKPQTSQQNTQTQQQNNSELPQHQNHHGKSSAPHAPQTAAFQQPGGNHIQRRDTVVSNSNHTVATLKDTSTTSQRKQMTVHTYKSFVNTRVDFSSLVKPNTLMIKGPNKTSVKIRKTLSVTQDENFRPFKDLDVLLITFEGVLGAFLPKQPTTKDGENTETLIIRPKIKEALTSLLSCFKVVIITKDQSSLHLKTIIKTLNNEKVPFDALFQTIRVANDNFFTYQAIMRDLDSQKLQIMFLTSTNFLLNLPRDQKHQRIQNSEPQQDYSLLPISSGMEKMVIMCVSHLLIESQIVEELDLVSSDKIAESSLVFEMTAVSDTIISLFNVSLAFAQNELVKEERERSLQAAKDKRKKLQKSVTLNTKANNNNSSTTPGNQSPTTPIPKQHDHRNRLGVNNNNINDSKKFDISKKNSNPKHSDSLKAPPVPIAPPKNLSEFQLLTYLIEDSESLYPIGFFKQKVERQKEQNTFIKAFEKGQAYKLFTVSYEQPLQYNRQTLGLRLQHTMIRIRSKLQKIKQAMRIVAYKESQDDRSFRVSQKNYELQRKQPAFVAFQKYNAHYFSEIYDECQVRLPCHPSKEQFEKLQSIYKSLQSRLDNLINNTFPFSDQSSTTYNLMLFDGHLYPNKARVEIVDQSRSRQFVLKDTYFSQSQAIVDEIQKNVGRTNDTVKASKMSKIVPDLIAWLSEKQPVFSATNAVPKPITAKQGGNTHTGEENKK